MQFNNGNWEKIDNESSSGEISLPIEEVIKMLPIPFDDETDIVVLKVHCGVQNYGSNIGMPYVLDNYEANKYIAGLVSYLFPHLVSATVDTVSAAVLFFNDTYEYDVILSGGGYRNHVEEEYLKYYDETEAYAVLPMINTEKPAAKSPLSPTITWETCPEGMKEANKATWKELNEFL